VVLHLRVITEKIGSELVRLQKFFCKGGGTVRNYLFLMLKTGLRRMVKWIDKLRVE
jgi:hypothetical protein